MTARERGAGRDAGRRPGGGGGADRGLAAAVPPRARREPRRATVHGVERVDEYGWLRERDSDGVIAYLESENAYTDSVLAGTSELQEALYQEMLGRIEEDDATVPVRIDDWWYHTKTETGRAYPIHARRHGSPEAAEQVLVDVNALAEGHDYFRLGAMRVSPDHARLALATDAAGSERYTLAIRDIASGEVSAPVSSIASTSLTWGADAGTLFFVELDEAQRPWRVRRHVPGADPSESAIVLEEPDERFWVSVHRTRSRRFILVDIRSKVTSETWLVPADDPERAPRCFLPRVEGVEYDVGHRGDTFYVRTNDGAKNFRLLAAGIEGNGPADPATWREVVPHRPDVKLEGLDLFRDHAVRIERADGLRRLVVVDPDGGGEHEVALPEPVASIAIGSNPMYDQPTYRFSYSSLVTPATVCDYHVAERRLEQRKRQKVKGGYDPGAWETRRLHARADDGTRIPISIVHARGRGPGQPGPCVLYGYGAYGISIEPEFSSVRLSLLERGFAFAIAHVRGGGELGEPWHDAGRMERKANTFTDFIACADHLVETGWADRDALAIRGGSAGGLLVGAVLNMRPDISAVAIANVPFVDVVNTMLDESLPLTVTEYEEWGNPTADVEAFRRMLGYSPYDNVRASCYPHLLVTAGLNDPRVQYWEPAKWVAKLRRLKACDHRLLLKTNMGAGHSGPSGRYPFLRERAFELAFLLDTLGPGRG